MPRRRAPERAPAPGWRRPLRGTARALARRSTQSG